ncbi:hypothetical protein [Bacillus marinisedimentorum]|uniref:hypothetical protein n=1 Tax=Bacillus marinisedimentorum TaxID=1821260 RepID=UPI000AD7999A|nr:hypothetical protein [Bacillus marinisedimentorum]
MKRTQPDSLHEGRDKVFVDVDRMINEGLAGGTVTQRDMKQIEKARDLVEEDPPNSSGPGAKH